MPPGWTKAVNSKTLMDSFAKVDTLLKEINVLAQTGKRNQCKTVLF